MRGGGALTAILALVGLLVLAPVARADYDPLSSGATKLTLDKRFLALLKQNGVKLSAVAPARLGSGSVSFPVVNGKFDPTSAQGTVEHGGALAFKAKGGGISLKALQLKTTQRHSPLSSKVGGSQLKLARAGSLAVSRWGFGSKVKVAKLTLSAKFATRLGKKLGLRGVFAEGDPFGSTVTRAQPDTVTVLGEGRVELTLDPGFEAKLRGLFVAVNPIFPAEHSGAFTLPIFGGEIAPDGSRGTIETSGALEFLQQGGGQVFWTATWLDCAVGTASPEADVRPSPPYAGMLGRVAVAGLAIGAISANATARMVAVSGTLSLQAAAAATFNEVFAGRLGKGAVFTAGETLGSVSFVALGQ